MPQNRDALRLEATPSAVSIARRWVGLACAKMGRPDLVECAALGTSELVTNAILHGEAPLNVRVRGTVEHPRIEVFDSSQMAPVVVSPLTGLSEDVEDGVHDPGILDSSTHAMATHGRGLLLVSRAANAWGATIEDEGKVVWFEPAPDLTDEATPGIIDQDPDHAWEPLPDAVTVSFLEIPPALLSTALVHYVNLRRELRLLAISHDAHYPIARDFSPFFATFERQLPPRTISDVIHMVNTAPAPTIDVILPTAPRSAQIFATMRELFDLADAFCREQRLLSLARTPLQRAVQEWILLEFIHQVGGATPRPWHSSMVEEFGHVDSSRAQA